MGIIFATVTMPACEGCCAPAPEPTLEWSCESVAGTATLYGISGYSSDADPYDAGDPGAWEGQYRKWAKRELGGNLDRHQGGCATCPGDSAAAGWRYDYSGTYEVGAAGVVSQASVDLTLYAGTPCAPGSPTTSAVTQIDTALFSPGSTCPADLTGGEAPVAQTYTLINRTLAGCGCHTTNGISYRETIGTATEDLGDEQYLFDAILEQDEDAEEGTECCSALSAADLTTPESTSPITMTGRASRSLLTVAGGDPEIEYGVKLTLRQDNDDPDPPDVWEVTLGIMGGTPTYYYHPLPAPGDHEICVDAAVLL